MSESNDQRVGDDGILRQFRRYGGLTYAMNQDLKAGRYSDALTQLSSQLRTRWMLLVIGLAWLGSIYRDDLFRWPPSPTGVTFMLAGVAAAAYSVMRKRRLAQLSRRVELHAMALAGFQEPIILDGDGGADIFRTKGEAERYAEPIDIRNGEYTAAYDANGRLLRLEISADGSQGHLTLSDPPENRSAELAEALRTKLGHIANARQVPFDSDRLHEYPLERLIEFSSSYYTP